MKFNRKSITGLALAGVLCFGVAGTLAWLQDETVTVQNTFTTSGIDIELDETGTNLNSSTSQKEKSFKMIPGFTISKDPKVTVKANSETCYVFVEVIESTSLDTYISYTVDSDWKKLELNDNSNKVYYRTVNSSTTDQPFSVLTGDTVTVNDTVTDEQMKALSAPGAVQPTLSFKAYAIQKANGNDTIFKPVEAWNKIKGIAG